MASHGTIHWSELCTADVDAAKAYYQATCDWTITPMDMPDGVYWICSVGEQPVAGLMDVKQLGDPNVPPHWMTYIAVSDVDKAVAHTEGSGGAVVRPPFDVPGVGRIAILRDPGGATVGMMTPAS